MAGCTDKSWHIVLFFTKPPVKKLLGFIRRVKGEHVVLTHHSQLVEFDVLLVHGLLDAVKRGSLFNKCCADILVDPYSGTLIFELMIPGPAQCGFFLLESREADQERTGGRSLVSPGGRGTMGSLQFRRCIKTSGLIASIKTSDMNFMGSFSSSLPVVQYTEIRSPGAVLEIVALVQQRLILALKCLDSRLPYH